MLRRTHEDKIERCVVCVGDLDDRKGLEQNVRDNVVARNRLVHDSRGRRGRRREYCV